MGARDILLAYFKSRRDKALAKMVPGQYVTTYNDAKADVAHYDKLIKRVEG